ncbi:MAG: hypothetical protein WBD66_09295, partial [Candidatus Acidiferrales bacterium]
PNYTPSGSIYANKNPRSGQAYFNYNDFSAEPLGSFGNSPRRFFHGPGLNNWDMALLKTTKITESKSLELRFEAFNVWNHTQFGGPNGSYNARSYDPVTGVQNGGFGFITSANAPRILQIGAKFHF